jgi:hypothetical protein
MVTCATEVLSREIQRTGDSWHVPIVDRDTWLCVNLAPVLPTATSTDAVTGEESGLSGEDDFSEDESVQPAAPTKRPAPPSPRQSHEAKGMQTLRDRKVRRPAAELMFLGNTVKSRFPPKQPPRKGPGKPN